MSDSRLLSRTAVFVIVRDTAGKVLLLRRNNTGYMDGRYDIPAGHVEPGERILETAVRELREETGITVTESDLVLHHVNQFYANGFSYDNFFFVAKAWSGVPTVIEPNKCDDVQFFALDDLPLMTAATHVALEHFADTPVSFGFVDQSAYDAIAKGA
jgi:8-oxo-dGTP diphosphatase